MGAYQKSHVLLDSSNCKLNLSIFIALLKVWDPLQIGLFSMQARCSDLEIMSYSLAVASGVFSPAVGDGAPILADSRMSYLFAMSLCASVYMCFVVTCWERADLLALVCGVYCEFVTSPLVSWVRCGT